ncbi:MAG: SDR family oxidoreductase [Halorientalis sp.]
MLEDTVHIVTGAASGLGRATALELADHGAAVVVADLGAQPHGEGQNEAAVEAVVEEIEEAGGEAVASFGDVTDAEYVASMVETTYEEFGRIDGAVNYAGFLRDSMSFNMSLDDWQAVVEVHLTGHFNLVRHLGAHWRERAKADDLDGERSFVAVSSASARGSAGQVNYSAAKAGVLGLTRTAARDLDRYGVRVNAMMPAAHTRMLDANFPEDVIEALPTDRIGVEKVPPLPAVLLSDRAEGVTGWTFAIGGDTVFTVTDPEFDRRSTMEGGWTAEALGAKLDDLLGDGPRKKTAPGTLLAELPE